jgi:hypothetical protein
MALGLTIKNKVAPGFTAGRGLKRDEVGHDLAVV